MSTARRCCFPNETGGAAALPSGSFTFDAAATRLYVRPQAGELARHVVQVSTRTYSAYGTGQANLTLKNLTFQLGNTSVASRAGLVTLQGGFVLRDLSRPNPRLSARLNTQLSTQDAEVSETC